MYGDLTYPFIAKIEGVRSRGELLLELPDGRSFTFDVSEIEGYTERLKRNKLGVRHWCEIGQHKNGQLYVEIVLTSYDFDSLNQDSRRAKSLSAYNEWKHRFKLPNNISPDIDLYYDSMYKSALS